MSSNIIYSVYKIENIISGKVYIGITNNFKIRILNHKNKYKNSEYPLYRAMRKYGWDNFKFEVIYQSIDYSDILNMESHFILEYKSYVKFIDSNGYNMTLGGEGSKKIADYSIVDPDGNIHKISCVAYFCECNNLCQVAIYKVLSGKCLHHKGWKNIKYLNVDIFNESRLRFLEKIKDRESSFKGKTFTDEVKRKMSESRKGRIPKNKGIPMSDEQKKKLSMAKKAKNLKCSDEHKKKISESLKNTVVCYNKNKDLYERVERDNYYKFKGILYFRFKKDYLDLRVLV